MSEVPTRRIRFSPRREIFSHGGRVVYPCSWMRNTTWIFRRHDRSAKSLNLCRLHACNCTWTRLYLPTLGRTVRRKTIGKTSLAQSAPSSEISIPAVKRGL